MRHPLLCVGAVAALALLLTFGCGGGDGAAAPENDIEGTAVLAPLDGATLEAYGVLDTGALTPLLGTTTTAADGSFVVGVGTYTGPVVLMATGGSYVDEATGTRTPSPRTRRSSASRRR